MEVNLVMEHMERLKLLGESAVAVSEERDVDV